MLGLLVGVVLPPPTPMGSVVAGPSGVGGIGTQAVAMPSVGGQAPFSARLKEIDPRKRASFRFGGGRGGVSLGEAVPVGDFNGDNRPDFAVSQIRLSRGGQKYAGAVYVVFGQRGNRTLDARMPHTYGVAIAGAFGQERGDYGDYFGTHIVGVGDVNGDGRSDLAVSAPYSNYGGEDTGSVYVIYGRKRTGTLDVRRLGQAGVRVDGDRNNQLPTVGTRAGDLNGDGLSDLLLEASGNAYVVFGRPTSLTVTLSDLGKRGKLLGTFSGGASLAAVGDVNGDGIDDLMIGHPAADLLDRGEDTGAAWVVFGSPHLKALRVDQIGQGGGCGTQGFRIDGPFGLIPLKTDDGAGLGEVVFGVGDINGDGYADVLTNARGTNSRPKFDLNSLVVVFGGACVPPRVDTKIPGSLWFEITNPLNYDGLWARPLRDVTNDGLSDFSVHAVTRDGYYRVFIVAGRERLESFSITQFSADDGWVITRPDRRRDFYGLAGIRSRHRDGTRDLLIVDESSDFRGREGAGVVYYID